MRTITNLHEFLDVGFGADGDDVLRNALNGGADPNEIAGALCETPLHVASRRRRASACAILIDHGAEIDATNGPGKTAFAHALRRGFHDVVEVLKAHGASESLNDADRFAVAVVHGRLDEARRILADEPQVVRTGNPEEDRLLADLTGRNDSEPVAMLIAAGADLADRGMDDASPLHQAAWFGQPKNAKLLIEAGAPIDAFDNAHNTSPLGWAVHGSRYSGGAVERQDSYVSIVKMLLAAGASTSLPNGPDGGAYLQRLLKEASPEVAELLRATR